ncbi:pseudouridine-5'-phosphate glycosidase [Acholeplasma equirhinis]|uniref:pseudouridine-5'-phosphate glycosidase n=1 Tax=Acholeplasma equirhinis TaxID=555393 RepID=UPI00197AF80B|nr:pseudouridine-5'-phosphate glycosidase [Acholeplasma equirhinis]MBN3490468.1 pseudouridine-5'-phosphate glycosidase [Acholeplasma equirhinis]
MNQYIDFAPEVLDALKLGKPVVALESTIISHGMPYPRNVEVGMTLEKIIKNQGATPATIAILDGRIKVGLTPTELTKLSQLKNVMKVSKRDIPYCIAKGYNGATTVSATILVAAMAGIKVFATGGIGGVHRKGQETFDISRDLEELANENVCVVSAGCKSILDIGLTLEYLETKGVPVVGYKSDEFPAFYTKKSGFRLEYQLDSADEIATLLKTKWSLPLPGGVLIANPIPDIYSLDPEFINNEIEKALLSAERDDIKGKQITPYLLSKIEQSTKGISLDSNIQLVYNNAKLAADIAIELSKLY